MGTFYGDVLTNLFFRVWGRFGQFGDVLTRGRFDKGTFCLAPILANLLSVIPVQTCVLGAQKNRLIGMARRFFWLPKISVC